MLTEQDLLRLNGNNLRAPNKIQRICRVELIKRVKSMLLIVWIAQSAIITDAATVDCSRPPLYAHPKDCCRMPPLLDDNLLRSCKQIHGGEKLTRGLIHERGSCFIECAMNATGTIVNGVLDQTKIVQQIASRTGGSGSALAQAMISSCNKCFQALPPAISNRPFDSKHCRPTASFFVSCVNMEMFKACLPEYWTNSEQCNALRLHITSCPIPVR
ncbi:uncharacterized protein LOC134210604 [Armigeres subalbatus]|uniref:uncharacterized protein LOC134210604 n=1 Tax=Armigeres subalbatus TaxID=124917 RepID=UPI002ED684E2